MKTISKNEGDLKNEDKLRIQDNLKNEDAHLNEDGIGEIYAQPVPRVQS